MFKAQTCKLSAQGQVAGPAGLVATRGLCLMVFVSVQPLKTRSPSSLAGCRKGGCRLGSTRGPDSHVSVVTCVTECLGVSQHSRSLRAVSWIGSHTASGVPLAPGTHTTCSRPLPAGLTLGLGGCRTALAAAAVVSLDTCTLGPVRLGSVDTSSCAPPDAPKPRVTEAGSAGGLSAREGSSLETRGLLALSGWDPDAWSAVICMWRAAQPVAAVASGLERPAFLPFLLASRAHFSLQWSVWGDGAQPHPPVLVMPSPFAFPRKSERDLPAPGPDPRCPACTSFLSARQTAGLCACSLLEHLSHRVHP